LGEWEVRDRESKKEYNRGWWKQWYSKPENVRKSKERWRKRYYSDPNMRSRDNTRALAYYHANRERINARRRQKYKDEDIKYINKLCMALGVSVAEAKRLKNETEQKQAGRLEAT
jgi:hypothetical protein